MRKIFEGALFVVEVSDDGRSVRFIRSAEPSRGSSVDEIDQLEQALRSLPAARMSLLIDVRRAVGRNDAEFEAKVLPRFRALTTRFSRVAYLVATQVGKLQIQREMKARGAVASAVFNDEAEARRFLDSA